MTKRVFLGLSGGVDSSVAAFLLKEAGYLVEAVFMKNWESTHDEFCSIENDLNDARNVALQLNIPFRVVNFSEEYWRAVFSHFLTEYQAGRTPNPDILCNREIKFKAFLNFALNQGADYIATGHYARINKDKNNVFLIKGCDPTKDQSYFLHALDQTQLEKSLFPIGELEKKTVRQIAKKLGFNTHDKKDSTGICFIGEKNFRAFLNNYLPAKPGDIQTKEGEVVGRHQGLMFYTIGQRQGLQIGGVKGKSELPWYTAHKDIARNVLIVVQGEDPLLYKTELIANNVHWINDVNFNNLKIKAKTRYRQQEVPCNIFPLEKNNYRVLFEKPERALTEGQSIVFYHDNICLGGGIISLPPST